MNEVVIQSKFDFRHTYCLIVACQKLIEICIFFPHSVRFISIMIGEWRLATRHSQPSTHTIYSKFSGFAQYKNPIYLHEYHNNLS